MDIDPYPGSPESYSLIQPNLPAFITEDTTISWYDWNLLANRCAIGLQAVGIEQDDRVAVRSGTRFEWFVINLALAKLGAISVMVSRFAKAAELAHIFADSNPSAVICDDLELNELVHTWREAQAGRKPGPIISVAGIEGKGVHKYQDLLQATGDRRFISTGPARSIIYTSGTTGRPKGVFRDPAKMVDRSDAIAAYQQYLSLHAGAGRDATYLLMHPMHHGAGAAQAQICLRGGGTVVIQPSFDPERTLALIERFGITNVMAVPTMLHRIRALPDITKEKYDVSSLHILQVGGASVPQSLKIWARDFFGPQLKIYETYGSTEVWLIAMMLPEFQFDHPGSSGQALPGVEIKIVDAGGDVLPAGETGEICARTPLQIDRYWNRPLMGPEDMTADGFYRTGDGGYMDQDGFLYVTDRIKDMIVSGGVNIYPAEIEEVLVSHSDVVDAAVIGTPNAEFGEEVTAFCEKRQGSTLAAEDLIAFCRERLTSYKAPKSVKFVTALPRNASGKILKGELRSKFWAGREKRV